MNLQQLTDELVAGISRPVVLVNGDNRPLAHAGNVRQGLPVRVTIPIRGNERDIASFRLFDDGPGPITSSDYAMLDAASSMVRDILQLDQTETSIHDRESMSAQLLDDDPGVRRQAFSIAVRDRWVDRGAKTAVRAVLVDPGAGLVRRRALARSIETSTHSTTTFIRERDDCLYFATSAHRSDSDLDARIRESARRFGLEVVAIGAAVLDRSDADLAPAADQARCAADILAALPELGPVGWYGELGPWVMLSRIAPGSVRVRDISPAADILLTPGNEIYRETVEAYLDAAGRNGEACERLHIHRTTLYYRLDKAPQAVREALHDGPARSSMHLALKLERLWNAMGAI